MKHHLTIESAIKLQKILSKRLGRNLTQRELEEAYHNLMEFAFALIDLEPTKQKDNITQPLAIHQYNTV